MMEHRMTLAGTGVDKETERIRVAFNADRSQMLMMLARQLRVAELEVVRALPDGLSIELDIAQWESILRAFESLENVHVITSNGSVTLECFGQFGNFSTWGEFFNVQNKSLDMHIRHQELAAVLAVQKPGHMDGVNTLSFQFFDKRGSSSFKVFLTFGGSAPTEARMEQFTGIVQRFRLINAQ
jgi:putative heme iron utilization protein